MDKNSFYNHLTLDLIPFWNEMIDYDNGGFYGYRDHLAVINKEADKSIILQNRIMWFYSNASLLLKDDNLLSYARHAFEFFKEYSYDKKNSGVFWSTDYLGNPKDTTKHTYNMAFAIYALASYFEASKDYDALVLALSIFNTIETKCKDSEGYLEAFSIDFKEIDNDHLSENGVMAKRTMNTLLHIIESYTNLYKVSEDESVKNALIEAINIFNTKIYNPNKAIVEVFLSNDYKSLIDLESYGHEIEASWLLKRALDILSIDELSNKTKPVIESLVKSVYDRGLSKEKNRVYYEEENGIILKKSAWWVEAEGVIGFYNAYTITSNKAYLEVSDNIWKFINDKIIDKSFGEWIEDYYDDESLNTPQALVHAWKCPYHNGRMCMEMINRLK